MNKTKKTNVQVSIFNIVYEIWCKKYSDKMYYKLWRQTTNYLNEITFEILFLTFLCTVNAMVLLLLKYLYFLQNYSHGRVTNGFVNVHKSLTFKCSFPSWKQNKNHRQPSQVNIMVGVVLLVYFWMLKILVRSWMRGRIVMRKLLFLCFWCFTTNYLTKARFHQRCLSWLAYLNHD